MFTLPTRTFECFFRSLDLLCLHTLLFDFFSDNFLCPNPFPFTYKVVTYVVLKCPNIWAGNSLQSSVPNVRRTYTRKFSILTVQCNTKVLDMFDRVSRERSIEEWIRCLHFMPLILYSMLFSTHSNCAATWFITHQTKLSRVPQSSFSKILVKTIDLAGLILVVMMQEVFNMCHRIILVWLFVANQLF